MLVRIMSSWDGGDIAPDPDGFVHLSFAEQVEGTVQRHYAEAPSLVFLVLDDYALPPGALRFEDTTGHGTYPHLYATLPATGVRDALWWRKGYPIHLASESLEALGDPEMEVVARIVQALADEDVPVLREAGAYRDGADPYLWTREYGRFGDVHLVVPPGEPRSWSGGLVYRSAEWAGINVDMWTEEERRSDLTLELTVQHDRGENVRAAYFDLHVM